MEFHWRAYAAWLAGIIFCWAAFPLGFTFINFLSGGFLLFMFIIFIGGICAVILEGLDSWAGFSESSKGALFGSLAPVLGIMFAANGLRALLVVGRKITELHTVSSSDGLQAAGGSIFQIFGSISPPVAFLLLFFLYAIVAYSLVLTAIHKGENVPKYWLVIPLIVFAIVAWIGWNLPFYSWFVAI